jgi:hypothetical protein
MRRPTVLKELHTVALRWPAKVTAAFGILEYKLVSLDLCVPNGATDGTTAGVSCFLVVLHCCFVLVSR